MLDGTTTRFSHVKEGQTPWRGEGLRDFFLYRDLGIEEATAGRVLAQLVKAHEAPEKGTGWHRHEADFHIVIMLKGWARFMYGDQETLVEAGDCVHQKPGVVHYLFDYSPDMEYLEIDAACAAYCKTVMAMPEMKEWAAAALKEGEEIEELDMEFLIALTLSTALGRAPHTAPRRRSSRWKASATTSAHQGRRWLRKTCAPSSSPTCARTPCRTAWVTTVCSAAAAGSSTSTRCCAT
jgi:mannose-6-phosphate isomerase-like protein (cupin superfamily)